MDAATLRGWTMAILIGSWSNAVFFTLEVILFVYCMRICKLKRNYNILFYALFLNDSVATLFEFADIFFTLVIYLGRVRTSNGWPVPVALVTNGVSAFIGQAFLIHVYWLVSKNAVISGFVMLGVIARMGLIVSTSVDAIRSRFDPFSITIASAVLSASLDVAVTLMVWWANRVAPLSLNTHSYVRRIGINFLSVGALVSILSLLDMILILIPGGNATVSLVSALLIVISGRLHSLTLLINVIVRIRYFKTPEPVILSRRGDIVIGSLIFATTNSNAAVGGSHLLDDYAPSDGPSGGTGESDGKPERCLTDVVIPLGKNPEG
ncbi:hypothetical protein C8R44DRAFT_824135 [Mycena epipterygia]|nr:hypothetical protein C8R44DRAFT_824135 [Mycena epipterygia]